MTQQMSRYRVVVNSNYLNQRGWASAFFANTYDEKWVKLYMVDGKEVWFQEFELEKLEDREFE